MKISLLILLLAVGAAQAQTNGVEKAPAQRLDIKSDSWDFSQSTRQVIYRGHVRVTNPQLQLSCELLTVTYPVGGGHPDHLQSETNVVIDYTELTGAKYHITAAKAVYDYKVANAITNESGCFSGNPKVEMPQGQVTGEPIFWERVNGQNLKIHAENPTMGADSTNGTPLKLF